MPGGPENPCGSLSRIQPPCQAASFSCAGGLIGSKSASRVSSFPVLSVTVILTLKFKLPSGPSGWRVTLAETLSPGLSSNSGSGGAQRLAARHSPPSHRVRKQPGNVACPLRTSHSCLPAEASSSRWVGLELAPTCRPIELPGSEPTLAREIAPYHIG